MLIIGLLTLLPLLEPVTGHNFYLLDRNGERTNNGLLIADNVGSDRIGAVCDDQFDNIASAVVCKEIGYTSAVSFTSYRNWDIQARYDYVLDDVTCYDARRSFDYCHYVLESDCAATDEQVFLECTCDGDTYITPGYEGCAACPSGARASNTDKLRCTCGPGLQWQDSKCEECLPNTYKPLFDDTPCNPCPQYSTSEPGAAECSCPAGFKWGREESHCIMCSAGSVSGHGSDTCYSCPIGSSPMPGNAGCSCKAGSHWNSTHCTMCPDNTYSSSGAFSCSECPENTVSMSGSGHCSECPSWHVWRSNYTCDPCSEGMTEEECLCPAGYSRRGQICVEDANPMKQTGSPKDVTAIILGVILFVFLIIAVLLFIKFRFARRRPKPPSSAAPLVPYHVVRDSETSELQPVFSPLRETEEDRIYQELHFPQVQDDEYVAPDNMDPMYVESDRTMSNGGGEYQEVDENAGYSVFCGAAGETEGRNNAGAIEENIYDNI